MNIDRIFIINLEYRKDRKQFQEKQIKKYNLQNVEFFKGIVPNIEKDEINKWNKEYCYQVRNSVYPGKFLNYQKGCLGCLLSHYLIMKIALERGYNKILILEDDAEIIDDIKKFETYSKQLDHQYDMLYLGGNLVGDENLAYRIDENLAKLHACKTTASYVIHSSAYDYILDTYDNIDWKDPWNWSQQNEGRYNIDKWYATSLQSRNKTYGVYPCLAEQRDSFSDLMGKMNIFSMYEKWNRILEKKNDKL